jgi:hypothetical protein
MQEGQLLMTQADRDRLVALKKAKKKLMTQPQLDQALLAQYQQGKPVEARIADLPAPISKMRFRSLGTPELCPAEHLNARRHHWLISFASIRRRLQGASRTAERPGRTHVWLCDSTGWNECS